VYSNIQDLHTRYTQGIHKVYTNRQPAGELEAAFTPVTQTWTAEVKTIGSIQMFNGQTGLMAFKQLARLLAIIILNHSNDENNPTLILG
jgi:hypothetical protein